MKKNVLKIVVAVIAVLVVIAVIIFTINYLNRIKENEVFSDVSLKREIPRMYLFSNVGIVVEDSGKRYYISYMTSTKDNVVTVTEEDTKTNKELQYWYFFDDAKDSMGAVFAEKGWNQIIEKNYNVEVVKVDEVPFSISGTVTAVAGNTAILRKCFE